MAVPNDINGHAATGTQNTVSGQNWWPTADVTQGYKTDSYGYTLTQTKTA